MRQAGLAVAEDALGTVRGRWAADGRHLEWELSQIVKGDPALSTRGMDELARRSLARVLDRLRGEVDDYLREAKKGAEEYIERIKEARAAAEAEENEGAEEQEHDPE